MNIIISTLYIYHYIQPLPSNEIGPIFIPILQLMELKPRELKWPVQGHAAYNAKTGLTSSSLTADYMLFTNHCCDHIIITPYPFGDIQSWSDLPKTHGY